MDSERGAEPPQVPPPPGPPAAAGALGGRLHPAAMGVGALGQMIPLLFLVVAGPVGLPLIAGIGAVSIVVAVARWYRFTWQVDTSALVIEQGLLERRRRVIPLNRIQSVETVRKLRHRLFGVVALRVESVGGQDSEGTLDALDPALAERLRRVLLRVAPQEGAVGRPGAAEEPAPGDVLVRLPVSRLVVAGLTGGRVGVAAVVLGLAQDLWMDRLVDIDVTGSLVDDASANAAIIGLVVVVALAAIFLLSVGATALMFWDFVLWRQGDNLRIRRGLLEQRSDTIPLTRVQAVRIEQNLVRRLLGLAAVKVEIAGRAGSADQQRQTDVVLPIGRVAEAAQLADAILGREVTGTPLQPMPAAARTRRLVRAALVTAIACLPAVVDLRAAAAVLLLAPLALLALADYRALGFSSTGEHVLARNGVFLRRLWLVPTAAVQTVRLSSTPFQRRRNLATLTLHVPRSGAADPALIDMDADQARALMGELAVASTLAGRGQMRQRRQQLAARLPG